MDIVQRTKNICLTPKTEWPVIAAEPTSTNDLILGYAAPLAAIGAIAGFIGGTVVGISLPFAGTYRVPMTTQLGLSIFSFVMALVGIVILAFVINALAPTFSGEKNSSQALKVAVYSYTPAWIAGVLHIIPTLGLLIIFAALYGLYLLYLGLPVLMKCPQDKAAGYTVIVVVCAIVVAVIAGLVSTAIAGTGMYGTFGAGGLGGGGFGARRAAPGEIQFDKNSPLGKLQDMSRKLDESNKKMEAAQKAGDSNAAMAAAMSSLGTVLGGGKHVDPVNIDQLTPFVPETFAGLPKTGHSAEKTGIASLMVSHAQATYGEGGSSVTLEISDTGGASGLMGLASWVGVQSERDDDQSSERTVKVNGRLMHEKVSKTGGSNEFAVVLGERFVVAATGRGLNLDQLRTAVTSLDLGRLEAMKDVGVEKQ